jgi:spermidine synthase
MAALEKKVQDFDNLRAISTTRRWMPEICGDAFEDPRVEVIIQDAADYVEGIAKLGTKK